MTVRTKPPFRADHVGSLLRPPALLQAREDAAEGRITAEELRAVEDEAIVDAVRMQENVGLRGVTDGELRRSSWHMDFIYALDGISTADDKVKVSFHNEQGDIEFMAAALHVDSRVGVSQTIFGDAYCSSPSACGRLSEADDPVAEHGPLPRRPGRDRPERLSGPRRVLGRPHGRLSRGGTASRRARLHVPPARRHEPRLPERPRAAPVRRLDRGRPGRAARRVHPPHQRGSRRTAG